MLSDKLDKRLSKLGSTQHHQLYNLFFTDLTENPHLKYGVRYAKYKQLIDKMIDQALEELIDFEECEARDEKRMIAKKELSSARGRFISTGESIDSEY